MIQQVVSASIITIGDELLIGQTIDTNSAWMAVELNKIGINVKRRVAVGDDADAIKTALDQEALHSEIILITGGLGPTADDLTKPLLCTYFGGKMIVNEDVLQHIHHIFTEVLKRPLLDRNLKQAEVPDVCTVLPNPRGTAPGMWFEKNDRIFISMPGVPHEMKGIMEFQVLPQLRAKFQLPVIAHRTLLTAGIGESFLAERLIDFESALPVHIKLAYLPNYGMVRLRLSSLGFEKDALIRELESYFTTLQEILNDVLVVNEDLPLEEVVGRLLVRHQKTMATAESCSGGYIAHLITSISGSSEFYKGTVVAYSYDAKETFLDVPHHTLEHSGAVSEQTVTAMLKGLLKHTGADYGIATSGIMGPGGGTSEKPVGTVWVAVGSVSAIETYCIRFRHDRKRNIELTAANALLYLLRFIERDVKN
jgi:nicotinamide-nucleotide amidase